MPIAGLGMGEPICLPVMRRPLGWRELDDKTLLSRAHGLIAAHCAPLDWPDTPGPTIESRGRIPRQEVVPLHSWQLPPSDHFILEEWRRMEALHDDPKQERSSEHEPSAPKGGRYPGWVLTASLVLVGLQLAMLLVAISPNEVIENVKVNVRQWQITWAETGSAAAEAPSSDWAAHPKEQAHWWKSWHPKLTSDIFNSSQDGGAADRQHAKPANEVAQ
jgi:hypothetical protein